MRFTRGVSVLSVMALAAACGAPAADEPYVPPGRVGSVGELLFNEAPSIWLDDFGWAPIPRWLMPSGYMSVTEPLSSVDENTAMAERMTSQTWEWRRHGFDQRLTLRFIRDGDQLVAQLSDDEGLLSPNRILSAADVTLYSEQREQLSRTIAAEFARTPEYAAMTAAERRDVTRRLVAENGRLAQLHAQTQRSRDVRNAYENTQLPPTAFSVLATRDGAVLQARYGHLVRLYYLTPTPDGEGLYFYHQPGAGGVGAHFPDRPGRWTRLQRRLGLGGRQDGVAVLPYRRAPDTPAFPTPTLAEAGTELDWPMRLTLLRGGEQTLQFLDTVGEAGWHASSRIELRPASPPEAPA